MGLGLGLRERLVRFRRKLQRHSRQSARRPPSRMKAARLHIGSGRVALPGWVNVDLEPLPGVDYAIDVREGLPFHSVEAIYAEHFIEHLTHDEGTRFLAECREALTAGGILRLSTPNLDWVWATQYRSASTDPLRDCFAINKSFRGWGHQFLYNEATLRAALLDAGFADVVACRYGESAHEALRGLEHHERSPDGEDLPHVIILEASGRGPKSRLLDRVSEDYDWSVRP